MTDCSCATIRSIDNLDLAPSYNDASEICLPDELESVLGTYSTSWQETRKRASQEESAAIEEAISRDIKEISALPVPDYIFSAPQKKDG